MIPTSCSMRSVRSLRKLRSATSTMDFEIRTIREEEFEQWVKAGSLGFGSHATDEHVALNKSLSEADRTFGAFDGSRIVGTTTTRPLAITIPGGSAKLGYVDEVAVIPTHRRRGILTRMMRSQLDQMRERGEPMAALGASESLIYERFGFGIATWSSKWKIDRRHTSFKFPPQCGGHLDFIDKDAAREEWPKLYARLAGDRPGMVHFNAAYWAGSLRGSEGLGPGTSDFFHVAYIRGERVSGLVSYRIRDGAVLAIFLLGEDSEVEAELWRYCFGIDLMTAIEGFNRPTDDPLLWRLEDSRRLERSTGDQLWLRLIDVEAALESRSYDTDGELTLGVHDSFCEWNDGVYTLEAGPDGAVVSRNGSSPDIDLTAAELAAAYLGGVSFDTLARAGRVQARSAEALDLADRMFRTPRAPWTLEM